MGRVLILLVWMLQYLTQFHFVPDSWIVLYVSPFPLNKLSMQHLIFSDFDYELRVEYWGVIDLINQNVPV